MINETTNYKIKKPTPDEYYDIALNNENADIIDGAIKINADAIATKQAIITGGASTIASANLPVKKAVVTDSTGKITVADVTDLELSYVKGVTGALQTQINTKAPTSVVTAHTGNSVIHVTAGDKAAWNAKETPSGAQTKATTALTDAKSYVDGKVTSINGKTGVITKADIVALGIPAQDTVVNISGKVDVEVGKGLSTNDYTTVEKNKLAGLSNYTHPSTHPASMITESTTKRFVTDAEKTAWNAKLSTYPDITGKVDVEVGKGLSTNDYTTVEKNKLAGVDTGANNYTHPSTHPASMITESTTKRFVTDAEKTAWNAKTTDANLIIHEADAVKHITSGERATWNNKVNISTGGVHKNKFVQTDADGNIKKFDTIQSADVPVHSAGLLTSGTIPSARIGSDIGRSADLTTHAGLSTHITGAERTKWNKVTDKADTSAMNSALETKADTSALTGHMGNTSNPHLVTKAQIGLGNVNNTSDSAKPISTATQNALNGKADITFVNGAIQSAIQSSWGGVY